MFWNIMKFLVEKSNHENKKIIKEERRGAGSAFDMHVCKCNTNQSPINNRDAQRGAFCRYVTKGDRDCM